MSVRPAVWVWARMLAGAGILALLGWRVGAGPFLEGVRAVHGPALVAASGIGLATTMCCAQRWSLVAAGLGVRLPLRGAVAAYYRSQFLNTTLPGGVVGDVHRAVDHGLGIGDVGLAVRAVVLERCAGQAVQVLAAIAVLVALPSPVRAVATEAALALLAAGLAVALAARVPRRDGSSWWRRSRVASDIRNGLFARRTWVGVLTTSGVAVTGHMATFLLAARTVGSLAPLAVLVPLTLLALLAMALPINFAGWGPREGMAAWAFAAAGLGAAQGVATAVTYGVLVFVASLPGAGVLILGWWVRRGIARGVSRPADPGQSTVLALPHGGAGG
jgi:glycosyltransferase 2 family protein